MCGIAGFIKKTDSSEIKINNMVKSLSRRGPDGYGTWNNTKLGIALGQTRLSIIDLSDFGKQPMCSHDGRLIIVFNGEIFNYKELRNELKLYGYNFFSQSDTEVILIGWEHWGTRLLNKLRGMFAFAIWDNLEKKIILCRDRFGIKPLFLSRFENGFIFASTIDAILKSGFIDSVIETKGIFDILATGSICQPRTIIKSIESLEPGNCLIIKQDLKEEQFEYWSLSNEVKNLQPTLENFTYDETKDFVKTLIEDACRANLISDVPVGSFLSGGIDSSIITSVMASINDKKIKSYSVGFENTLDLKNELNEAKIVANFIGTDHTEVFVTGEDVRESLDDFIEVIDQPSYDGLNSYFVSKIAGRTVKSAVSGLGGDEIFAGYQHFESLKDADLKQTNISSKFLHLLHKFKPSRFSINNELRYININSRYANLRRDLTDTDLQSSFKKELLTDFSPKFYEKYIDERLTKNLDSITLTSVVEIKNYLLNTLLRDVDAISMGQGLEVRPVFLDHILVVHALAIPSKYKIFAKRQKALLKDSFVARIPNAILERQKTGFTLPTGIWLRTELRKKFIEVINSELALQIFSDSFIKTCNKNLNNKYYSRTLWTVFVLLLWINRTRTRII